MDDASRLESIRGALSQKDPGVHFAPIRHHSPACAWAVRQLIRDVKPRRVLIEAPVDLAGGIAWRTGDGASRNGMSSAALSCADPASRNRSVSAPASATVKGATGRP